MNQARQQRTLSAPIAFSGIGIHTGKNVSMRFCPAKENSGIVFKRVDLPSQPIIPATLDFVVDTSRSTILGKGDVRVHTVEHVLAALRSFEIDNLLIEVDNLEPPVGNGSSDVFVEMIEKVGIQEQSATLPILQLKEPVFYSEKDIQIVAIPSTEYRISYTLSYPSHPVLNAQFHSFVITSDGFKKEIAPCSVSPFIKRFPTL